MENIEKISDFLGVLKNIYLVLSTNIDILVSLMLLILFIMAIFSVKDIIYRIFVFFTTVFLNILLYGYLMYLQYNFLIFIILQIFLIFITIFLILKISKSQNSSNNMIDSYGQLYLIKLLSFFILTIVLFTFITIKIRDLNVKTSTKSIIVSTRKIIIKNNTSGIDTKEEVYDINRQRNNIVYTRDIYIFSRYNEFWKKYSIIIMFYILVVILLFFITQHYVVEEKTQEDLGNKDTKEVDKAEKKPLDTKVNAIPKEKLGQYVNDDMITRIMGKTGLSREQVIEYIKKIEEKK